MPIHAPPTRQRILVPMDYSEAACTVLKTAIRLADPAAGDVVQVLYVPGFYAKTREDASVGSNPFGSPAETAEQQFLTWAKAERPEVLVEALPRTGFADAPSIADAAIRAGTTLLVLAQRDYSLWERVRGKCPAATLPAIAPCPIHMVKRPTDAQQP